MLTLEYLTKRIEELTKAAEIHQRTQMPYSENFVKHCRELISNYEKEYQKALMRPQPKTYDKAYNEGRIGWSYGKGVDTIEPWRC